MFSFFRRAKTLVIAVNGCKKSKVLHTLFGVDTELFPFTVRSVITDAAVQISSPSIVSEATF